ncbi:hypothetical protein QO021_28715 (plasmid) [Pseudomonas amygdali pv. lachrymans]|uniref:hypothetical protein n=1 Tax=Pseudomonas amygdali TaxID=47877 RepID=UPI0006B8BA15|nr:hypothetical protein [Pseudomonas amygdali]RMM39426.1 hypothetical protein ALQ79_200534 [Pseudomonas amygdali pv. lachrymans]WIO61543.1 hypothetical protein QO021_28715 [Pseudomonas amygdali pv. lachrymans]
MTIQIQEAALAAFVIPEIVARSADRQHVETYRHDLSTLPFPFNTATLWVACSEAWPHNDPDFEGVMFISVVIQGCHRYGQLAEGNVVEYIDVRPGSIFLTNPLALHWLQPKDPEIGFVALQWEVPHHEYPQRLRELVEQISRGTDSQVIQGQSEPALVVVDPEGYIGDPPGFPSLFVASTKV